MKTWQLQDFGLENLKLTERPVPKPGPKQVLVKVKAVSLNYRDKAIVGKMYLPDIMPKGLIPVSDVAGEVVGAGAQVTKFKNGDRVISHLYPTWTDGLKQPHDVSMHALGGPIDGGLAEYMLLDEEGAVPAPASLTDEEASTLPIAALTPWFALAEHGKITAGQTVVVQGTGGVSLFAIQLAKVLGARVIVLSGSNEKLLRAQQLGADETINYKQFPDWQHKVLELTNGRGADNILEVVGGRSLRKSLEAVAVGGQVSVIGFLDGISAEVDLLPVIFKAVQVRGILVGNRKALEAVSAKIEQHSVKPVINQVYSFQEVKEAYRHLDRGAFGKIVIRVAE